MKACYLAVGLGLACVRQGSSQASCPDGVANLTISDIQGSENTSPYEGQKVCNVQGIVTAVDSNLFYFQDSNGDGNDATSDAVVVFVGDTPSVSVGDSIAVTGTVSEFTPGGTATRNLSTTQISLESVDIVSTGNTLPAPVIIGAEGRSPPSTKMEDGVTFFESLEAMRVQVKNPAAVAGTTRFGELFVVVDDGADATGLSERMTLNISPTDFNPEKVQIDPDSGVQDVDVPFVDTGTLLDSVTGVLGYNFGNFEVIVTDETIGVREESSLLPTVTSLQGDDNTVLIGTYNLLNLDPNDDDGDEDVANGRFAANARIIAENMGAPDVVGLQEIQDSSGSIEDDGIVDASATLELLIEEIQKIDASLNYSYVDNTFIGNNTSGGQPGGNIRTAFLYNTDRVSLVPDSVTSIVDPTEQQTNVDNPFFGSRLPLAATFQFLPTETQLEVVNVHFSSKGGSAAIMGVEQSFEDLQEDTNVNGGLDERQAQSGLIQTYVKSKTNVIVLGDFNEFEFVSPVQMLAEAANLDLLTLQIPENERYSFIFQGNSQSLDHILVGSGFGSSDAEYVHVNCEFAETPSRASDHDPMVASISTDPGPMPTSGPRNPIAWWMDPCWLLLISCIVFWP